MTEIEREAETYAKRWAKALGADFLPASIVTDIAATLTRLSRPPAGHIRDDAGVDRRVLGLLPVTKDGCVLCPGEVVWAVSQGDYVREVSLDEMVWPAKGMRTHTWSVRDCYSTREAAEAAAEKERGQ